ncbi:unnamed protein product [Urochloa humidicola]
MAPAGVISSVLGMGGRAAAARVAAAVPGVRGRTVTVGSTPPPSAAFVPAVLPGVRGRTVSARSTPPPSAAIVPAAVSGVRVRTVSAPRPRRTPPPRSQPQRAAWWSPLQMPVNHPPATCLHVVHPFRYHHSFSYGSVQRTCGFKGWYGRSGEGTSGGPTTARGLQVEVCTGDKEDN